MAQDRRHHYVPAFYLAQFTETQSQEGDLWVFDGKQNRSWKSTPRGSAHEKDFNRIDVPDVDPLAVEKEIFGTVETIAAPVIRGWCSRANGVFTLGMPGFATTIDELSAIFTFIAAQSIRVPRMRESIDKFHTDIARRIMALTSRSDEVFAKAQESNEHLRDLTRDDLRELLEDPGFKVTIDTAGYFQSLLPAMTPITDLLGARKWGIIRAPSMGTGFICSDDPVVLLPPKDAHPFFGTGFGTPGSIVCLPLSPRHALWGIELEPGRRPLLNVAVISGSDRTVATVNRSVLVHSHRFLYAASEDFSWLRDDNAIGSFEDLRKHRERQLARGQDQGCQASE